MSLNVNWKTLETDALRSWTLELLTDALNSGRRPHILALEITIKDLNFGKVAPDFEILEIGELEKDRFRGIFKINYSGDFSLTLHTKVQANPLKIHKNTSLEKEVLPEQSFATPDFLLSLEPFNIPLDLKLSDIQVLGIGVIVFSKSKGLTLVFRNDPLDSIKVSSTFDTVQVLANFLQKQIEHQIRELFRETLPTVLHKLSLRYTLALHPEFIETLHKHVQLLQPAKDTVEVETVLAANLRRLAALYGSRETLGLHVPKLRRIVQRNHLQKINKHLLPNLGNLLYSNLNISSAGVAMPNNSIPASLVAESDYEKVGDIMKEIAHIQAKLFRLGGNNQDPKRPKRRVIKMGKAKPKEEPRIEQPIPLPARPTIARQAASYNHITQLCASPLPTPFVGGVGLNGFGTTIPSPLRRESARSFKDILLGNPEEVETASKEKETEDDKAARSRLLRTKRSHNHIDLRRVHEKLMAHMDKSLHFDLPPPPYHVQH